MAASGARVGGAKTCFSVSIAPQASSAIELHMPATAMRFRIVSMLVSSSLVRGAKSDCFSARATISDAGENRVADNCDYPITIGYRHARSRRRPHLPPAVPPPRTHPVARRDGQPPQDRKSDEP